MTSSMASYEQLVRQVEALKAENNHLRQELRDNSSHLSKLETETSGMKVGWRGWAEDMGQGHRDKHQGTGPQGWVGRAEGISQGSGSETAHGSGHANQHSFLPPSPGGPEALTMQAGAGGPSAGVLRAD